jgi:hypothetical protein
VPDVVLLAALLFSFTQRRAGWRLQLALSPGLRVYQGQVSKVSALLLLSLAL